MTNQPNTPTPEKESKRDPTLLDMLKKLGKNLLASAAEIGEPIAKPAFAINRASAGFRTIFIFIPFVLFWFLWARLVQQPDFSQAEVIQEQMSTVGGDPVALMSLTMQVITARIIANFLPLFHPAVFRRIMLIMLAFWVAFRIAAIYLDDIFEIGDTKVAANFIRQAAFYTLYHKYNRLVIKEGRIAPRYEDSPIYRIGGPGMVRVQLENVAVFEKVDGTPHIIGPTRRFVQLDGFERLRKIIDLREQFPEPFEVKARTRDGIEVTAKDVRMIFSVHRNKDAVSAYMDEEETIEEDEEVFDEEENLEQPLTFTELAVKNLVYKQANRSWTVNSEFSIKGELRKFISSHGINDFLANVTEQDISSLTANKEQQATQPNMPHSFTSRGSLTDDLYKSVSDREDTFDLHWFGVGTWVTPDIIPQQNLTALLKSLQNRIDGSDIQLKKLRNVSRWKELLRLIQDVPINAFGMLLSQGKNSQQTKHELMLAYREKIKNAYDAMREGEETPSNEIIAVLRHLERL
jgi:hypothetical protein